MEYNAEVFLSKAKVWGQEMKALRQIALDCNLSEQMKWGKPCYSLGADNIFLIHAFKDYCAYLFLKGALLSDPEHILVQQTANVQSARQIRFTSLDQIVEATATLKAYIFEAIEIEKAGLKVSFKTTSEMAFPEEFQNVLDNDAALKSAFWKLKPGRQKGYLLYFSSAKQAKTRVARVEKSIPLIISGKGLDD
jgi:uncharacterized protein YdeI (YjbR/CyaY-like superfamily)